MNLLLLSTLALANALVVSPHTLRVPSKLAMDPQGIDWAHATQVFEHMGLHREHIHNGTSSRPNLWSHNLLQLSPFVRVGVSTLLELTEVHGESAATPTFLGQRRECCQVHRLDDQRATTQGYLCG